MLARIVVAALCLGGVLIPASARDAVGRAAREWVADVVERVQSAASVTAATSGKRKVRTLDVHVRVAADGAVLEVAFGEPPPSEGTEKRLRAAVMAAGPFGPPPSELLAPDGSTGLDFPLRVADGR